MASGLDLLGAGIVRPDLGPTIEGIRCCPAVRKPVTLTSEADLVGGTVLAWGVLPEYIGYFFGNHLLRHIKHTDLNGLPQQTFAV